MKTEMSRREEFGRVFGDRRQWRVETTREIRLWRGFRRRQMAVRAGVLASFALAMFVYPLAGTISPAYASVESLEGINLGEAPETIEVVLGLGPQLEGTRLPPPSPEDTARALVANSEYIVSIFLPSCDGSTEWSGTNGNISEDSLCTLWDGRLKLRSDAAVALASLNHQYKLKFGKDMCISSTYRTLGEQYAIKRSKGYLAARPGSSNHGWGLAIDLCQFRGEVFDWMEANGPAYGWENPEWAKTQLYEPWHWEYYPGTSLVGWRVGVTSGSGDSGGESSEPSRQEDNPDPEPSITAP